MEVREEVDLPLLAPGPSRARDLVEVLVHLCEGERLRLEGPLPASGEPIVKQLKRAVAGLFVKRERSE